MTPSDTIALKKVNSANLQFDNSGDTERAYDVSAATQVSNGRINSASGEVVKDGIQIADFSCHGSSDDNLTVNFQNVPISEQCAVLTAVQEFLSASRTYVRDMPSLMNI